MMNKQELIKNIKLLAREASQQWPHEEMVELRDVLREINQLDEPEVLSQEWIDKNVTYVRGLGDFIEAEVIENLLVPKQEELETKIQELIESYKQEEDAYSNPENGWISGFIEDLKNLVEKEQKYYVLLPEIVDNWRYVSLAPNHWGVTFRYTDTLDDVHEFTEQEIKDYDERYWAFAKPVEEMEE